MPMSRTETEVRRINELIENAKFDGLPDKAFFNSFTARRRREMVYTVQTRTAGLDLTLHVHGSGSMKGVVKMPGTVFEHGQVSEYDEPHVISWARTGEEAVLQTRLDHHHLKTFPCPRDIMAAFIEAMGTHTKAMCPGGYRQWKAVMQLFAARVARETKTAVEIVVTLPLPAEHTAAGARSQAVVEIHDISDAEAPSPIHGYERDIAEIDQTMTPEAMSIILLPPGYLVCRWHREIFHAG